ncbi:hypothetical protein B2J88_46580 [Rhodococcus sp. SRB_17]|nr:hypothetical protein [Rhodococcus sp. SRB_17]
MTDRVLQSTSIYDHFRGLIVSGRLGRGEKLPTVRQTARDLGVSPGTAARAYRQLEQDGLVVARTGAGTKVSDTASPLPAEIVELVRKLALKTTNTQVDPNDVITSFRAELNS